MTNAGKNVNRFSEGHVVVLRFYGDGPQKSKMTLDAGISASMPYPGFISNQASS